MDKPASAFGPGRAVTIRDVATHAGVSTATVSRALASPERVSEELLARVSASARELGYTPNSAARTLRAGASRMILVDAPGAHNASFHSQIFIGLEETFAERGYTCIFGSTSRVGPPARRIVELAYARQVDGAIMLTGRPALVDGRSVLDAGVPIVCICVEVRGFACPSVLIDDDFWARRQVGHLASLGHQRVLYVGGPQGNYNEVRRRRGFKGGAASGGLAPGDLSFFEGDFSPASGAAAARAWIAGGRRTTGIVCACDDMAMGFMSAAAEGGFECPRDYSIVGFDGLEYAHLWKPRLTTVVQPRRDLAAVGAALLLRALDGDPAPPETRIVLDCAFEPGGSSGPPPSATPARRGRKRRP